MDPSASLKELREDDLDTVSAGQSLHFGKLHFGNLHFGNLHFGRPHFGKLYSSEVVQTNTAVEIAVVIGGGSVVQVINQLNVA